MNCQAYTKGIHHVNFIRGRDKFLWKILGLDISLVDLPDLMLKFIESSVFWFDLTNATELHLTKSLDCLSLLKNASRYFSLSSSLTNCFSLYFSFWILSTSSEEYTLDLRSYLERKLGKSSCLYIDNLCGLDLSVV